MQNPRQVRQEHILCGNGAADLIFRAVWAMRPRSALIAVPTFSEYEQALTACGCKVDYFELKAENGFQLTEELLEHIQPQTDIVFLCNPNNPTGQLTEQKLLERILARCASCGALLVVDECFRDFLDEPMQNSMNGWVKEFPNLMILRAFTKHYADGRPAAGLLPVQQSAPAGEDGTVRPAVERLGPGADCGAWRRCRTATIWKGAGS